MGHLCLVIEIPLHAFLEAGLEGFLRCPAEFPPNLAGVNRVRFVVAGTVGDIDNSTVAFGDKQADQGRTYKTGSASDKDSLRCVGRGNLAEAVVFHRVYYSMLTLT